MQPDFFDNKMRVVKDELVERIDQGDRVTVAASVFSMYAYQELREQLDSVEEFRFIFTSQAFTNERPPKEKREFYIPRLAREQGLCGTEFEIKLRNELTQKAVAAECAEWIRRKARFKSYEGEGNSTGFLDISKPGDDVAYMPFNEFSTAKLGMGSAVGDVTMRLDSSQSAELLRQFDAVWNLPALHDVTDAVIDGVTAMYQENAPELVYYMALYRIFSEFLDDVSEDVLPNEGLGFRDRPDLG